MNAGRVKKNIAKIKMNDTNPRAVTGLVKADCAFVKEFVFIRQRLFVQLIHQLINPLNKIQSMAKVKNCYMFRQWSAIFREFTHVQSGREVTVHRPIFPNPAVSLFVVEPY
jgi:hypothetical protein